MKNIHILGNKATNFENPKVEDIKKDGWKPIYKNGKIIDWK